jgi:hypothetical protein
MMRNRKDVEVRNQRSFSPEFKIAGFEELSSG